jgi:membrane-associated phospholipid phosphatase
VQTAEFKKRREALLASTHRLIVDRPNIEAPKVPALARFAGMAAPLIFIAAGFAALLVDCSLSHWCVDKNCPLPLENLFYAMEPFGNGLGVAIIGLTIFCLDPRKRWAVPRILGCVYSAGLAANVLKMMVSRTRPHSFDFHGGVWTTFGDWFPMMSAGSIGQSFPSGHTTTAVALAAALVWLYPRGWWLFPTMALLVGCHRVETGAHFLSDVFWGAALGSLISLAFLKIGLLAQWFDSIEKKMGRNLGG